MCARNVRTPAERVRRLGIVFQFQVIGESQTVIELPVVGIVANPELGQRNGTLRFAGSVGRLGSDKITGELERWKQMRIELGCNFQQRGQQVQVGGIVEMLVSEILDGARPVQVGDHSRVSQAHYSYPLL